MHGENWRGKAWRLLVKLIRLARSIIALLLQAAELIQKIGELFG